MNKRIRYSVQGVLLFVASMLLFKIGYIIGGFFSLMFSWVYMVEAVNRRQSQLEKNE